MTRLSNGVSYLTSVPLGLEIAAADALVAIAKVRAVLLAQPLDVPTILLYSYSNTDERC
jgi:hypothetical protein